MDKRAKGYLPATPKQDRIDHGPIFSTTRGDCFQSIAYFSGYVDRPKENPWKIYYNSLG